MNYLLAPVVDFLERRGLSRDRAVIVPFFALAGLIGFGVYKIVPLLSSQAEQLEARLPTYQTELMNLMTASESRLQHFAKAYNLHFSETLNSWLVAKTEAVSSALPSAISGSFTVMMLAPLFAFFMLKDGRKISRAVLAIVPNAFFEMALTLQYQLDEQMGGFIRARLLEAGLVGFVVWVGLQVTGFPYATLLGLFAGLMNLIPYVGPIAGAVPALAIALISPETVVTPTVSLGLGLTILTAIYVLAQLIDIVFIIPMVVARIVNLHPVAVILVIIVGAQTMGIMGMIISIPVASAIKLIGQTAYAQFMEFRT
jgi:putative permease